ncbi:hypothetical protein ZWY2020_050655 [Hordeum vulgare]|nr:hypothetical protein ZWY2020_057730 [Hordeum vulgare]KAI4977048.1 hypothetical protein ZWY2020_050655 [Hordeum vulgare]
MEQFHHGQHVRLRSRVYGTYLHADEDGRGVSHRGRRASMSAAWGVDLHHAPAPHAHVPYLLLHSAANGRYLAATNQPAPRGLHVEQRSSEHPEVEAYIWQAILTESEDAVYVHHLRGGRLRASGSLHWNTGVSVDDLGDLGNVTPNMHWVVEPIPARGSVPRLPRPSRTELELPFNQDVLPWRMITYLWPNVEGALVNHDALLFRGRSVLRLRDELAWRLLGAIPTMVNVNQLVMCLPTRDGRFFPLVVDLPADQQEFLIVVVMAGSPAHVMMRYADVDAG